MNIARALSIGLATFVVTAIVACGGGEGSSEFGNGNGGNNSPNDPGNGGDGFFPGGGGSIGGAGGVNAQCATSTAKAELVPVYLVFMYDRSGSMNDDSKWTACRQGMKSFFSDAKSAGINASLAFFQANANACDPNSYATPSVNMRPLPDTAFGASIDALTPNGGTPTLPALRGAIAHAKTQAQAHPGAKVAVVLVTDGQPNDCNSSVDNVSNEAKASAAQIPTYVVGVGTALQNLDRVAQGGGTSKAFIVATNNPQQTADDFQKALQVIRGAALSCEFKVPTPPVGKDIDYNTVNVVYSPSVGARDTLTYNATCQGGTGWHYDNAAKPTKIVLCDATCTAVQKDQSAKIDVVTGCATKGGITK
jgi:uncharacterized protein YegL